MKMLVHRSARTSAPPFVLKELAQHLRVADPAEEIAIQGIALAAALEIEEFAQIALLTQTIRVSIFGWSRESGLGLPIGPVDHDSIPTVTLDGETFADFDFEGGKRPYIRWRDSYFDLIPSRLNIEYQAGFGSDARDIPADLAMAVMDQAALLYDGRAPMDSKALTSSPHFARIGARYRGVQM